MTSYQVDANWLSEERCRVENLVSSLPLSSDQQSFNHPWELRAFAMVVAAHKNGLFEWSTFQSALIESIAQWQSENGTDSSQPWSYYEHWLTAFEVVLANKDALSTSTLNERTKVVLATPRNAHHHAPKREPVAIDPARV